MRKTLLAFCCFFFAAITAHAQVMDGLYVISITPINLADDSTGIIIRDTATVPLWEFGNTHKAFFATDSTAAMGIMTDTVNVYPINANNFFIVRFSIEDLNPIINFQHRYQTTAQHDGGVVEFSLDSGLTWQNVKGDCNVDDGVGFQGILTTNFYATMDTLMTGQQAFSGTSDSTVHSRLQFFIGVPQKSTDVGCTFNVGESIYLRFRFISDSVTDSLAGWIIDSMQIEYDYYGSGVANVNKYKALNIFPNPSYEGVYNFPPLANEQQYSIEVYDAMGSKLLTLPYNHSLNISKYAHGMYFYKVTNGTEYYSGRLLFD